MQILKVLLVVVLVVNLTSGFFFKKKKVYVHHPAPAYPQYAAPYQYTYSYYYQPIPYYHHAPVSAAPAPPPPAPPVHSPPPTYHAPPTYQAPPVHSPPPTYQAPPVHSPPPTYQAPPVHSPPVLPPAPPAISAVPVLPPAPPAIPALPVLPPAPNTGVTHLSNKQALPVFEPATFTSSSKNIEIIPAVGYQMGTTTDVIEMHKSEGTYIELPIETVSTIDSGITTSSIVEIDTNVDSGVPSSSKTTLIKLNSDVPAQTNSRSALVSNAKPSVVHDASRDISDSRAAVDSEFAIDVRTTGENIELPSKSLEDTQNASAGQLVEEVILPADDKVPATDTATTLMNEPVADPLLNMRAFEQGNAATGTGELVIEGDPSSADVLSFPEVQQLLNELIKNEEFDAKRLTKKDTISSGGAQSTKSVEIDPQVSYSRVVRQ